MNEQFITIFTTAFILLILYMVYENWTNEIIRVEGPDNQEYLVRNLPDKEDATSLIAEIRGRLIKFIEFLSIKYPDDLSTKRLVQHFDPEQIMEKPNNMSGTSVTINKKKIIMCLRDTNDKLEEVNRTMFVALHEVSHIANTTVGHGREFWDQFKEILERAVECGIYKAVDYSKSPEPYCGIEITSSPIF